jgi:hypothetical protein
MTITAKVNVAPPNLPLAPLQYDREYFDQLTKILRLYFNRISVPQDYAMRTFSVDVERMPTEADVANLRVGDVYRDTTADNALKVKV